MNNTANKKPTYSYAEMIDIITNHCEETFEFQIVASLVVSDKHRYSLTELRVLCVMINARCNGAIIWK